MFSKRIISMLVVLSFISQTLVVVDTDSYSSVVVEDFSILEELSEQDGARGSDGIELVWDSPGSGMPDSIISMGDYLLYGDRDLEGCDGGSLGCGWELFRSDGTAEGSGPLKDINLGKNSSSPSGLTEVNGIAYFKADDGTNGKELWRSDGTEDGTFMVKDINPDGDSYPLYLTALGDELLFKADDGTHGYELWKSDGTADGTVLVKDLNIGEGGASILGQYYKHAELLGEGQGFVTFEGSIYFMANNGTWSDDNRTGNELWRSDGTSEGTYLVKDIGPGNYAGLQGHLHILGNHIYFPANDNSGNGTELWRSDGTAEGTVMVKDIHPGGSGMFSPGRMILVDNNLFFFGNDGTSGQYDYELWKTDGTEGGTVKVSSDAITSGGHYPVVVGDIFYFMGENETYGKELWRSDGTDDGTFMVKDLRSGSDDGCCGTYPYLVPTGDILYFGGYNETEGDWRMHQTDGTSDGTFPVAGADGIGHPSDFTYMDNSLFFRAPCLVWPCGGTNLHKIGNITPLSTPGSKPSYSVYESEVLEPITFDYAEAYREEMVYKGSGNLSKITDIGGASSSYPDDIVVIDDIAYFTASSSEYGEELWRTDGTESGVALVKDIHPGSTGSEINHGLVKFKDSILFSANDGTHGEELWISDGTENGTFMLKDMDEGDGSSDSDPYGFLDAGDFAYFSGSDDSDDRELWKTDGTTNGTVRVKNIVSDGSSNPGQLTLFGDTVFFTVGDGISSTLWKTCLLYTSPSPRD